MRFKKIMVLTIIFTFLLAISAVSAAENATDNIIDDVNTISAISENVATSSIGVGDEGDVNAEGDYEFTGNESSFADLQTLIDNATEGDTIVLLQNYLGNGSEINVNKSITIDGNNSILNANGLSWIFNIASSNVVLKNMVFTNGKGSNGGAIIWSGTEGSVVNCSFMDCSATDNGGSIYFIGNSSGTIKSCIFTRNKAPRGGAIYLNENSGVKFDNCSFTTCSATVRGGAIYINYAHNLSIVDCDFMSCSSTRGGAIFLNGNCSCIIRNCSFGENHAKKNGGAIYGQSTAINCVFNNNSATEQGGAIAYSSSAYNCTFNYNHADYGGALFESDAYNSTFNDNDASVSGGAMYNNTAFNCTFNNNQAKYGGAMFKGAVYNCIFNKNQAQNGGALRACVARNCILNNNRAENGGSMHGGTAYNCTFKDTCLEIEHAMYNSTTYDCTFNYDVEMNVSVSPIITFTDYSGLSGAFGVCFNDSIHGTVSFLVDGKNFFYDYVEFSDDFKMDSYDETFYFGEYEDEVVNKFKKLSYGIHSWEVIFTSCPPFGSMVDSYPNDYSISKKGTFYYSYGELWFNEIIFSESSNFDVSMPRDAGGYITLYIDGVYISKTKFKINTELESCSIKIPKLSSGKHKYTVVHSGSSKYPGWKRSGSFEYSFMNVDCSDVFVSIGNSVSIDIEFPADITGTVNIIVNNKTTYSYSAKKVISCKLNDFTIGTNNITVRYLGSSKYSVEEFKFTLDAWTEIKLQEEVAYCDHFVASLNMPKDAKGKLVAILDGEVVDESGFIDGKANVKLPLLSFKDGTYDVVVKYNGTDYVSLEKYAYLEKSVGVRVIPKIILPDAKNGYFSIQLPKNATGTVTVSVGQDSKSSKYFSTKVSLKDGKAKVDLSKYVSDYNYRAYDRIDHYYCDWYSVSVKYEGNYPLYSALLGADIPKPIPTIKIKVPKTVFAGKGAKVEFTLPSDALGYVTVWAPYENSRKVSNGKVSITLKFNTKGTKTLSYDYGVFYDRNVNYAKAEGTFKIVVLPLGKISAKDASLAYSSNSNYKVKVLDKKGKPVSSGVSVIFKINGKTVKKAKTDKNGYASYKITNAPGNYKITVQALGDVVTKKLTVKHVVAIKDVTVKKSSKKLTLQATLSKVNGKYLAKKTITFKINGKKVATAKTNSKGVAKVTVNTPDVVKNLEDGKTVTYQATYLKDTVTKTTKIKK